MDAFETVLPNQRYINEFTQLRRVDPSYSNWLLFSATVESFLRKAGAPSDTYRISSSLRKIEEWYVGDGWYSDGLNFAFDYYNSFVIHPMYIEALEIITEAGKHKKIWNMPGCDYHKAITRAQRFGVILERLISPEGTLPVVRYVPSLTVPVPCKHWHYSPGANGVTRRIDKRTSTCRHDGRYRAYVWK